MSVVSARQLQLSGLQLEACHEGKPRAIHKAAPQHRTGDRMHVRWRSLSGKEPSQGVTRSDRESYRDRTDKGYACVERSEAEGLKQRVGRCHRGYTIAHGPAPPHINPNPPPGDETWAQNRPGGSEGACPVHGRG
eukprot:355965-Chlamydomonas_euryale.AAC.8